MALSPDDSSSHDINAPGGLAIGRWELGVFRNLRRLTFTRRNTPFVQFHDAWLRHLKLKPDPSTDSKTFW